MNCRPAWAALALILLSSFAFAGIGFEAYNNITVGDADYILSWGTNYTWTVNVSTLNTDNTSVLLNQLISLPLASSGATATPSNWSAHTISYRPEDIQDWEGNCTYTSLLVTVRAYSDNATHQLMQEANFSLGNVTVLPCVEAGYYPTADAVNDKDLALSYPSEATGYSSLSWLPTATYNSTHKYCPYGCTANASRCISYNYTPTLTAGIAYCEVNSSKNAGDPVRMEVYNSSLVRDVPPYTILPGGAVVAVVVVLGLTGAGAWIRRMQQQKYGRR